MLIRFSTLDKPHYVGHTRRTGIWWLQHPSALLLFSEFFTFLYTSFYVTWLHVVFLRTLFPNPVPLDKILLLYHPNQDEEHTLRTKTILRRISPSRLTHYKLSTDYTSVRLFQSLSLPHDGNHLASNPPVPCPSERRIMQWQQFSCDPTSDATLHHSEIIRHLHRLLCLYRRDLMSHLPVYTRYETYLWLQDFQQRLY
jgi:hypothetical protein